MILVYSENDVTYLAISMSEYLGKELDKYSFFLKDNLTMFKALNTDNIIIGVNSSLRDSDLIRYESWDIKDLTYLYALDEFFPQVKNILKTYYRIANDQTLSSIVVAYRGKAFVYDNRTDTVTKVNDFYTFKDYTLVEPTLQFFKNETPLKKVVLGKIAEMSEIKLNPFPMAIIDTESTTIKYYHSLEEI